MLQAIGAEAYLSSEGSLEVTAEGRVGLLHVLCPPTGLQDRSVHTVLLLFPDVMAGGREDRLLVFMRWIT